MSDLEERAGRYRTRFPPEPNGYLHLGHAKAMAFNFGQAEAARREGIPAETILRFDDTNPEAEKHEYFDAVVQDVSWLGHEPVNITHTSDYFDDIYQDALRSSRFPSSLLFSPLPSSSLLFPTPFPTLSFVASGHQMDTSRVSSLQPHLSPQLDIRWIPPGS